jgi:hypothetical protein
MSTKNTIFNLLLGIFLNYLLHIFHLSVLSARGDQRKKLKKMLDLSGVV